MHLMVTQNNLSFKFSSITIVYELKEAENERKNICDEM